MASKNSTSTYRRAVEIISEVYPCKPIWLLIDITNLSLSEGTFDPKERDRVQMSCLACLHEAFLVLSDF